MFCFVFALQKFVCYTSYTLKYLVHQNFQPLRVTCRCIYNSSVLEIIITRLKGACFNSHILQCDQYLKLPPRNSGRFKLQFKRPLSCVQEDSCYRTGKDVILSFIVESNFRFLFVTNFNR